MTFRKERHNIWRCQIRTCRGSISLSSENTDTLSSPYSHEGDSNKVFLLKTNNNIKNKSIKQKNEQRISLFK